MQEGESRLLLTAPHEQLLRLLQGEPIALEPYFGLMPTPDTTEPMELPTLAAEPDWEEPVFEPIRLEESPFELTEPTEAPSPNTTAVSVSTDGAAEGSAASSTRRGRRRARRRRKNKAAHPTTAEPAAEMPIAAIQWRRPTEER
jgi:hypothetical protein